MFGIDVWFLTTIALAFLLALSLWKNITGWRNLKNEAISTLKDLYAQLIAHQAEANALKAKEIDVAQRANPAANPNVAGVGVDSAARKV